MRWVSVLVASILICCAGAVAQETQEGREKKQEKEGQRAIPEEAEKELARILKQLDSDEYKERALAEDALTQLCQKIGEPIAAVLTEHAKTGSPQVKQSIEKALEFLSYLKKLADCRKLLSIFDTLGMPNIKGKKLVLYNTGGYGIWGNDDLLEFHYVFGWVLSESEKEIEILENTLTTSKHTCDHSLPARWYKFKDQHPKEAPLPGYYKEKDFAEFCEEFLKRGPTSYFGAIEHFASGGLSNAVEATLYAYWALQHGTDETAIALVQLAKSPGKENGEPRTDQQLAELITSELSVNIRWRAINHANQGFPRPEILKEWKTITKLPENRFAEEAKEMVRLYEELIAEDNKWTEPAKEQIDKMTTSEKVLYWMYKLRDASAWQMCQPGSCSVFLGGRYSEKEPNPAEKLLELGWDAIPALIEHFDDPRPSRCMGYWRHFAPGSFYLLRYGDCCQQIFAAMTGICIYESTTTSGAMVKDGKAPEGKKKAQEWWDEQRSLGPEKFYVDLLETKCADEPISTVEQDLRVNVAATQLILINKTKYLPKCLDLIGKYKYAPKRHILTAISPHLGDEHKDFVQSLLSSSDLYTVGDAARILWNKWKCDSGVKEVIKRAKTLTKGEEDKYGFSYYLMQFLKEIYSDLAFSAIAEFVNHPLRDMKTAAIEEAFYFPCRRVLEAVMPVLDDKDDTGYSEGGGYRYRYCDKAAYSICEMVDYGKSFSDEIPLAERDKFIDELKAWLAKNKDMLDWEALRRRAEERIKAAQSGR